MCLLKKKIGEKNQETEKKKKKEKNGYLRHTIVT